MSEELATIPRGELLGNDEFDRLWRTAKALAAGRMFKDVTQAEQAFSKMLVGYYLGMNPSQSMMGIQLIRGNVSMSYPTMGAFVKSRPGYDYKILTHTDESAEIEFTKDGVSLGTAKFTVEDARRAKLIKSDGGWETYPENMCVARALSKGIRFFMPEALGGIPVYALGEIPQDDLSIGEGTGEAQGVELPAEVEELIARAEELGHVGWAERSAWEYRQDGGDAMLRAGIAEAAADLDELEKKRAEEILNEPDVPIDTTGLPPIPGDVREAIEADAEFIDADTVESDPDGGLAATGEAPPDSGSSVIADTTPSESGGSAVPLTPRQKKAEVAAPGPKAKRKREDAAPEFNAEIAVRRLKTVLAKEPGNDGERQLRDEEVEWLVGELRTRGGFTNDRIAALLAGDDSEQGTLL